MEILQQDLPPKLPADVNTEVEFASQQPLAVVWDDDDGRKWYIGLYLDENDDRTVRVDHLQRQSVSDDTNWKRPQFDDIHDVNPVQILPCPVNGEWDFTRRTVMFIAKNSEIIRKMYEQLF